MEWSHFWSLLVERQDQEDEAFIWIQHQVAVWIDMVEIARKGFEVLSKGEGQAMARPRNLAKSEEESTCI